MQCGQPFPVRPLTFNEPTTKEPPMDIRPLIHKRVLLTINNAPNGYRETIQEYKVLELSPSGNFVKLQNTFGSKFWRALVEVLQEMEAKPNV
jgi:hypothetical protein